MCIPSPRASALPASNIPSMASASGILLGGQGVAAGLGRLKLREGNNSGATTAVPKPASQQAAAQSPGSAASQVGLGGIPQTGLQVVPNGGLRLPTAS